MRIAEGGVGEKQALLFARPLGEFLGSEFEQKLACSRRRRLFAVIGGTPRGLERRGNAVALSLRVAVHNHIGEEGKQARGAVAAGLELEERRRGVDERGRRLARGEFRIEDDIFEERNVCLHAANAEFAERAEHSLERHRKGLAARGDLRQKRVVEWRDHTAGRAHAAVEANAETRRASVGDDLAVVRHEFVRRIFGGNAGLDGVAIAGHCVLLRQRELGAVQGRAGGDEDLGAHEVNARDLLGDGVLDLNAGVHLNEEPLFFIHIVEELDRSGVVVADAGGETHGSLAEVAAHAGVEVHGRRDLDHLLVAALDGAVALVEVEDIAVTVTEDLHLDVLRARNVFFEEHGGVAERPARLALRLVE